MCGTLLGVCLVAWVPLQAQSPSAAQPQVAPPLRDFRAALTFHASFEDGPDADWGAGDRRLYHSPDLSRKTSAAGLPDDGSVSIEAGGRLGRQLKFQRRSEAVVFYRGGENITYDPHNFNGTIALWMKLDPDRELAPGYVDPLQLTDKDWNNAALFVDFTKDDSPRHFRLGVFSDLDFWNPQQRQWEAISPAERPMIDVAAPPFRADRWTHVVFIWQGFNRPGGEPGEARLFLDGQLYGPLQGPQQFTWDPSKLVMMLGVYYTGGIDELAAYDRPLGADEVRRLMEIKEPE
jgi:hypothetical protein